MNKICEEIRNDPLFDKQKFVHKTNIHIAVLVYRKKIIAKACNSVGSRSKGCGYSNCTIHAEKNVIKKIGNINRIQGSDLYIFRRGVNNKFINSTPCLDCKYFLNKCINKYKLKNVYYTVTDEILSSKA